MNAKEDKKLDLDKKKLGISLSTSAKRERKIKLLRVPYIGVPMARVLGAPRMIPTRA